MVSYKQKERERETGREEDEQTDMGRDWAHRNAKGRWRDERERERTSVHIVYVAVLGPDPEVGLPLRANQGNTCSPSYLTYLHPTTPLPSDQVRSCWCNTAVNQTPINPV